MFATHGRFPDGGAGNTTGAMNTQSERPQERTAEPRRKMTPAEAGSKGGRATRDRHGTDFFRKIGSIGGSRSGGPRRHGRPLYDRGNGQQGPESARDRSSESSGSEDQRARRES